ncbi:MAG: hypothetical protein IKJ11_08235 [Clostridia bacterium]|nr:hypothetical protein [Clostridia bacterium]
MNDMERSRLRRTIGPMIQNAVTAENAGGGRATLRFNMQQEDLVAILEYLVSKGMSADAAVSLINQTRDQEMQLRADVIRRSGLKGNENAPSTPIALKLLPIGLSVLYAFIVAAGGLPVWTLLPVFLFAFFLFWIFWNPQSDAEKAVLRKWQLSTAQKLDAIYEIQGLTKVAYMKKHVPVQLAVFVLVFVLSVGGVSCYLIGSGVSASNYHKGIVSQYDPLQTTGSTGTRFAVYDEDKGKYVNNGYLPEEMLARKSAEVAGVLKVGIDAEKVGWYDNGVDAMQYYAWITLYDCATGRTLDSAVVYGSEPPNSVSRNALDKSDVYGGKPDKEKIARSCRSLIEAYYGSMLSAN